MSESTGTTGRADAFAQALQRFEQDGDAAAFARLFADGAQLVRPEQSGHGAARDAEGFWREYAGQFGSIRSQFHRVAESGDLGELEWTSTGTVGRDREVSYDGVSLLEFDDDGRVRRFATYYDTQALALALR